MTETNELMKRPTKSNPIVKQRALEMLMPKVKKYLGGSQWIKCYGIAPARKVGDIVSTTNWHRKGQIVTISSIYEDRAQYAIHFPDQTDKSSQLIDYEEVVDAPMVVA